MKSELIKTISFAAFLGLAAPAVAQENGEAAPAADPAATLDMGTDVNAGERKAGQAYVAEVIGAWEQKCIHVPDAEQDPCQMYQLLKDENGNPVAEISLGKLPDGSPAVAGATVIAPLETLLTQQLTIGVDDGSTKRYPFRFCAQMGCVANIGFTAEEVSGFKKGAKAKVVIVPAAAPKQQVNLTMSLEGFTKSFDALSVPATAAAQ